MLETLAFGNLCFHLNLLMGYWQAVNETTGLASKHSKVQGSDILNAELAEFRRYLDLLKGIAAQQEEAVPK